MKMNALFLSLPLSHHYGVLTCILFNCYKGNENEDPLGDDFGGSSSENGDIFGDSGGTAIVYYTCAYTQRYVCVHMHVVCVCTCV